MPVGEQTVSLAEIAESSIVLAQLAKELKEGLYKFKH